MKVSNGDIWRGKMWNYWICKKRVFGWKVVIFKIVKFDKNMKFILKNGDNEKISKILHFVILKMAAIKKS